MKLAILGTGSVGHALAAHAARRGIAAAMLARSTARANSLSSIPELSYTAPDGNGAAPMPPVSADAGIVLEGADIVFLAAPAHAHSAFLASAAPHLVAGQMLVLIACFGALRCLHTHPELRVRGIAVAELSTAPFPCRSFVPGQAVFYGGRPSLPIAIYARDEDAALAQLSRLFDGTSQVDNPLATSLIAANPVIHAPLSLLNAGRIESGATDPWNLFHDGATPSVVEAMLACDRERIAIAAALGLPLPSFAAARVPDDVPASQVASRVSSYYRTSPMHNDPRQPAPASLAMRYVLEDVAYCFAGWAALAGRLGIPTPTLDAFISIYRVMGRRLAGPAPLTLVDIGLDDMDAEALRRFRSADIFT